MLLLFVVFLVSVFSKYIYENVRNDHGVKYRTVIYHNRHLLIVVGRRERGEEELVKKREGERKSQYVQAHYAP